MFDRIKYKLDAKEKLKKRRFVPAFAFLFTVACALVLLLPFSNRFRPGLAFNEIRWWDIPCTAAYIFIAGALLMANRKLLITVYKTDRQIYVRDFINGFGLCAQGFVAILFKAICLLLWSLLFVVPGIVKHYSWSFSSLILAENPSIGIKKSMRISKILTTGNKSNLFFTDLSFIPLIAFSCLTAGILFFWTVPYMRMTKTSAYQNLKKEAFRNGSLIPEDFDE